MTYKGRLFDKRPNMIIHGLQQYARENRPSNDISNIKNKNDDVTRFYIELNIE